MSSEAEREQGSTPEHDRRRTILMAAAAILIVLVGYVVMLLIGGTALRSLPFAEQIGGLRERLGGITTFTPENIPIPPLQPAPEGPEAAPSPLVARPSPTPSPVFIPAAPDDPSELTFVIEFDNTTGVRLTGVRITSGIPAGTSYRAGSASPQASFDGQRLVWELGMVDPGQTGRVSFQVLTTRKGRITNRAVLTSNEAPPSEVESSVTVN